MADAIQVGDALQEILLERKDLSESVHRAVLEGVTGIAADPRLADLLGAAVRENVSAVIYAVANGTGVETINAPEAGIEHARGLAQREVPVTMLLRAYRLGQTTFIEEVLARLMARGIDSGQYAVDLIRLISTYIDRISEQVAQAYYEERELWVGSKAAIRQHWVNQVLTAETPDIAQAEVVLRYRLGGCHVAVEAWIDGGEDTAGVVGAFDRLVGAIRRVSGIRHEYLVVPIDAFGARIWLPVEENFELDAAALATEIVREAIPIRVAIGDRRRGIAGFKSSSVSAQRVKALSAAVGDAGPRVLTYQEVAPVALITRDVVEVENFVSSALGRLAEPGAKNDLMRETLLAYLECNRSYHVAAERLHVHRNTVHYRVQKAFDLLGSDLESDPLPVQLALAILRWSAPAGGPA